VAAALVAAGCSPDGAATLGAPARAVVDFEEYPPGQLDLRRTWRGSRTGNSTALVVPMASRGQALLVEGGPALGDSLVFLGAMPPLDGDVTVQFELHPDAKAAPVFVVVGSGNDLASRQLRVFRRPESDTLRVATPAGNLPCGALASATWSRVSLHIHRGAGESNVLDVLVDGRPSGRCTAIATRLDLPVVGVAIMDPANEGYGGKVYWDNIEGR
jgi:hypothetical protein